MSAVVITGPPGAGKTTVLNALVDALSDDGIAHAAIEAEMLVWTHPALTDEQSVRLVRAACDAYREAGYRLLLVDHSPATPLGHPAGPGGADASGDVLGAFFLGAQHEVDARQARHRRGEPARMLDQAGQPRPARRLALDDALDQARRLGFQPHEEDLVRADRIQQPGCVGVGLEGLGNQEQTVPRRRARSAPLSSRRPAGR